MFTGKGTYTKLLRVHKGTTDPAIDEITGLPVIKENSESDSDYIPSFIDYDICPGEPVDPDTTTTSTSSTTSSSTTTTQSPINSCVNLVTQYDYDCTGGLEATMTFYIGVFTSYINVQVHYNNNIVHEYPNIAVIGGKASFLINKNYFGEITFVVTSTIPLCQRTFKLPLPDCQNPDTTTTSTSTSTTTSTSTSTTTSTTSTSTSTTSTTSSTTSTTPAPVICDAVFDGFRWEGACAQDLSYTYEFILVSGNPINVQYGYSLSNNSNTVTNWTNSAIIGVTGNGSTYYMFVRYGANHECVQMIGTEIRDCNSETTTSSTTTTTASPCGATFNLSDVGGCDEDGAYTLEAILTSGSAPDVEIGYSLTDDVNTVSNWSNNNIIGIIGDGQLYHVFVRYSSGNCRQKIGTVNRDCLEDTTTSSTTTTTPGCPTVIINSVFAHSPTYIAVDSFYGALTDYNYKITLGGVEVTSGTAPTAANSLTLSGFSLADNIVYRLFLFPAGCPEGAGYDFIYDPGTTTSSTTTTTPTPPDTTTTTTSSTTTTTPDPGTTTTSSTTTTTPAPVDNCSNLVNPNWNYRGKTTGGVTYTSFEDAQLDACFGGLGCGGYLSAAVMGNTIYTDQDQNGSCSVIGCTTLATGYYWIYPTANVDDVYVVHVTNGVIDQISANPC